MSSSATLPSCIPTEHINTGKKKPILNMHEIVYYLAYKIICYETMKLSSTVSYSQ